MELSRSIEYLHQSVDVYAHLPRIAHPEGSEGRKIVDDPDLWFASKINATLKKESASAVYWDKKQLNRTKQIKFIEGVRNHSWNRQHMGAMVVSGADVEVLCSSLVSSCFALGKFYRMQQQTRRSVILEDVINTPEIDDHKDVRSSFSERFNLYWDIVDKRPEKYKGFDPYIQDAFKILPLSTVTRFIANLDLRTIKGYTRWRKLDYLPSAVTNFSQQLHDSASEEYPIMFKSYLLEDKEGPATQILLKMTERIGGDDLMDEPMLWYPDHTFLLPENKYFEQIYTNYELPKFFNKAGPDALFVGYFNPLGIGFAELESLFKEKSEEARTALEMTSFSFASKIDLSGAIDTWRHTRSNRIVQPIYHALENNPLINLPALHQRQQSSGKTEVPERVMELSNDAVDLYHQLVRDGVSRKEAINVLPHNLELIQIEMMDLFSFLNVMAIRTCIHARPDVQVWAKSLLREVGKTPDFKGIDRISEEQSNLLARGIIFGYCAELGSCTKCGKEIIYLPDPFR